MSDQDYDEEFFEDTATTAAAHPASTATLALVLAQAGAELVAPAAPQLPAERERDLRAPNFTKMPTTWHGEHAPMMHSINTMAARRIGEDYADLFALVEQIKAAARTVDADTGQIRTDYAGLPESAKEHWALQLATGLVDWEQRRVRYWGEAMMAKIVRQEEFTDGYLAHTGRSTVEDRTQAGQARSLSEYYFAVLASLLHEHAKAACLSAERLCQRLKDASAR